MSCMLSEVVGWCKESTAVWAGTVYLVKKYLVSGTFVRLVNSTSIC
jgi:hypothetical protein